MHTNSRSIWALVCIAIAIATTAGADPIDGTVILGGVMTVNNPDTFGGDFEPGSVITSFDNVIASGTGDFAALVAPNEISPPSFAMTAPEDYSSDPMQIFESPNANASFYATSVTVTTTGASFLLQGTGFAEVTAEQDTSGTFTISGSFFLGNLGDDVITITVPDSGSTLAPVAFSFFGLLLLGRCVAKRRSRI
jgi:hypothetical protein